MIPPWKEVSALVRGTSSLHARRAPDRQVSYHGRRKASSIVLSGKTKSVVPIADELGHAIDLVLVCDVRERTNLVKEPLEPRRFIGYKSATVIEVEDRPSKSLDLLSSKGATFRCQRM